MKRVLAAVTVPVLVASLLAGCSDDQTTADDSPSSGPTTSSTGQPSQPEQQPSDQASEPGAGAVTTDPNAPGAGTRYCDLLGTDFASLFASIQGPDDVTKAVDVIRQIADEAPPAVQDDWSVMRSALGQMQQGLEKAAALQKKAAEGKVSQKRLQEQTAKLMQDMQALDTPENNEAGQAVSEHASDYCGIKLGG